MKLPISQRLLACCDYVNQGDRVADIGCDHGYLGIHLLTRGIARSMIESDINEGPLQSAMRNAQKYGVADKMSFHLSDGVQNIPRDFDALLCAGMGGDTMVHILERAPWLKCDQYRLILQCQSKTPLLRQYLSENGWHIARENVLRDGRFLYTVMDVRFDPAAPRLTAAGCYLSPALLENPSQELTEYREKLLEGLQMAVTHRNDPEKAQLLKKLKAMETL